MARHFGQDQTSSTPTASDLSVLLNNVFGTNANRTIALIDLYAQLYDLPGFEGSWNVDPRFFAHCTKSVNFVVIALHVGKKELFAVYSPTRLNETESVGWRLAGGPIFDNRAESIEEAVNRIVSKEFAVEIADLEPIATMRHLFTWGNNSITHHGIAFLARVIGDPKSSRFYEYGFFANAPDHMAFLNGDIFRVAIERAAQKTFEPPLEEIECAHRSAALTAFHRWIFKPVLYWFASKPLRKRLLTEIPAGGSILDASAGDDELILEIASQKAPEICIANDISWAQMASLRLTARIRKLGIVFTNHNIVELPLAKRFDVVIYKNTLHHSRTKEELQSTMSRLKAISKRLIIVDIEDPCRSKLPWFVHQYYVRVYGDEGSHFFTQAKFRQLISLIFSDASNTRFEYLNTLKGTYMLAVIDLP